MRLDRRSLLLLLASALPLAAPRAQQPPRHTITHEDVFLMKRVGAPTVSPDGRWAVFSVTEPSYAESEMTSDLWIVPTDGSAEPRRLTTTRGGESGAAWSPDGRSLAFSARREGDDVAQIYVLDVAQGGEAQRVTASVLGATAPRWRPDGRAILFTGSVYPGAATDSANRAEGAARRARKRSARVYDGFPVRSWDRWLDDRRPNLFVQPLEPGAPPRDLLAGTRLAAMPGFGGQMGDGSEGISAAWTPDGSVAGTAVTAGAGRGNAQGVWPEIDRRAAAVMDSVVAWRRDIHQHPELSNRETRTAGIVAAHLTRLGLEVRTGVAHTGVVGVLRGLRPGPVVALRADMDALPVGEEVDLPFASRVRTTYNGQDVGVMHACGHDMHTAILMGVAEVLSGIRRDLPGTVVFLFQPAEEGPPSGEDGGARMMIREGALDNPAPSAIFGLHVFAGFPVGTIQYRPGALMASSDNLRIVVRGRGSHGALPWRGVDPIVVASQIVFGLQTIVSRQLDATLAPAVITLGTIQGGVRFNVIPDSVEMLGTIRAFDQAQRLDIHERIRRTAQSIAQSAGATADVEIDLGNGVTVNDPALTERMVPTLRRVAGDSMVALVPATTTAEDFSAYRQRIPGMFFFVGVTPKGQDPLTAPANHSPRFFADEGALPVGVRALAHLAVDYLEGGAGPSVSAPGRRR